MLLDLYCKKMSKFRSKIKATNSWDVYLRNKQWHEQKYKELNEPINIQSEGSTIRHYDPTRVNGLNRAVEQQQSEDPAMQ